MKPCTNTNPSINFNNKSTCAFMLPMYRLLSVVCVREFVDAFVYVYCKYFHYDDRVVIRRLRAHVCMRTPYVLYDLSLNYKFFFFFIFALALFNWCTHLFIDIYTVRNVYVQKWLALMVKFAFNTIHFKYLCFLFQY